MTKIIDIEQIKQTIVEKLKPLNPEKIILFGSYAYGNPTEDSDLDLCVIKNGMTSRIEEKRKVRAALKSIKMPKDILVETEEYFLSHSDENWINTALYDVRNKGVVLYE